MTVALPIEYGSLNVNSVLGGLLFYREAGLMDGRQMGLALGGCALILLGIAWPFVVRPRAAGRAHRAEI